MAVKIIDWDKVPKALHAVIAKELNVVKGLDHPNVLKIHDVMRATLQKSSGPVVKVRRRVCPLARARSARFVKRLCVCVCVCACVCVCPRAQLYVALDLIEGGELHAYLSEHGRLAEPTARFYFRQLVAALGYVHSQGVVHGAVKPENMLLDRAGNLKLTEFRVASSAPASEALPAYTAPEVLDGTMVRAAARGAPDAVWLKFECVRACARRASTAGRATSGPRASRCLRS